MTTGASTNGGELWAQMRSPENLCITAPRSWSFSTGELPVPWASSKRRGLGLPSERGTMKEKFQ